MIEPVEKDTLSIWREIFAQLMSQLQPKDTCDENQLDAFSNLYGMLNDFNEAICKVCKTNEPKMEELQLLVTCLQAMGSLFVACDLAHCAALMAPLQSALEIEIAEESPCPIFFGDEWEKIEWKKIEDEQLVTNSVFTNSEIVFNLVLFLSLKDILNLSHTTSGICKVIRQVVALEIFWRSKSTSDLNQEQFDSLNGNFVEGKSTLLARSFPIRTLTQFLDKYGYFKRDTIPSINFNFQKGFTFKTKYFNDTVGFNLEDIYPLILQDNDYGLFQRVTRFGRICEYVEEDNFNIANVTNLINTINRESSIYQSDLRFDSFLPILIKFKAVECFKLFVRARIAIEIALVAAGSCCSLESPMNLVLSCNNNHFNNIFISYMLKFHKVNLAPMDELVKYAVTHEEYHRVFKEGYFQLSEEDRRVILKRSKNTSYHEKLLEIILDRTYELRKFLLESADGLLKDPNISRSELAGMQERVDEIFHDMMPNAKRLTF